MSDPALAFIRELERADEEVARVLAELDDLARETDALRARAVELEAFLVRLPAEREAIERAVAEAEREIEARTEDLERARRELAAAEGGRDRDRLAAARRDEVRARDVLRVVERRGEGARAGRAARAARADEAAREAPELEARARHLADLLRGRPRLAEQAGSDPPPGLAGVSTWAGNARAALFVARGGLAREREGLIRQANELGALVLGEPLVSASPSLVARRIERARG